LLAEVGIELCLRPARGAKDQGGLAKDAAGPTPPAGPVLGVRLQPQGSDAIIATVLSGGAALAAGLAAGDLLVAVDGLRVTRKNLDALIARAQAGAPVRIHAFRRDELLEFDLYPLPAPADTCDLRLDPQAPPEAAQRRSAWLASRVRPELV
jgi:predicted metalloprotease with PDZ domain